MNITLRRRARALSPDFWEEQFRLLNERSIVHAYVPDGATKIKPYTFQSCTIMQDVFLPNTITSIGAYAFQNCYSLDKITISNSCTSIGNYAFQNTYNLQSLVIPASMRTIGDFAFSSSGLVNLTISEGVVSLGQQAFANITALKNLVIPDSVTTLGNGAFRMEGGLVNITIGKGVTAVPNECFWTSKPTNLTMRRTNPPTIPNNAFQSWPTHIYVPAESVELYKTASIWSTYADRIEADPTTMFESEVEYLYMPDGAYFNVDIDPSRVQGVQITYKLDNLVSGQEFLTCGNFSIRQTNESGAVGYNVGGTNHSMYNVYYNTTDKFTNVVPQDSVNPFCLVQNDRFIGNLTLPQPLADSGTNCTIMSASGFLYTGAKLFDSNHELLFDGITVRKNGLGYLYDKKNNILYVNSGAVDIDEYGADIIDGGDHTIIVDPVPYDALADYIVSSSLGKIILPVDVSNIYGIYAEAMTPMDGGRILSGGQFWIGACDPYGSLCALVRNGILYGTGTIRGQKTIFYQNDDKTALYGNYVSTGAQYASISINTSSLPVSTVSDSAYLGYTNQAGTMIHRLKLFGSEDNVIFDGYPVIVGEEGAIWDEVTKQVYKSDMSSYPFTYGECVSNLYDSKVSYIDITGKYLEVDIDLSQVYGIDFTFQWNHGGNRSVMSGGDFSIQELANGDVGVTMQGVQKKNGNAGAINASGKDLRMKSSVDLTQIDFSGNTARSVLCTPPFSSTPTTKLELFKNGKYGTRIVGLKLYDSTMTLLFDGIPVRKDGIGYLFEKITQKLYGWDGLGTPFTYGVDVW